MQYILTMTSATLQWDATIPHLTNESSACPGLMSAKGSGNEWCRFPWLASQEAGP